MKRIKPKKGTRFVRIDHKTMIEVSPDKTDKEAIRDYLEKLEYSKPNK